MEWDFNKAEVKWFSGAKLNITENCIDRHLPSHGDKTAIIWEPGDPKDEAKKITYKELHENVCRVGNMLKSVGVKKVIVSVFICQWCQSLLMQCSVVQE